MEEVAQKINLNYTSVKEDSKANEKAQKIVQSYGDKAISWVWGPNAENSEFAQPPTGFAFRVRNDAPLSSNVFSVDNFFSGITAIKLTNLKLTNGAPISEKYVWDNADTIRQQLLQIPNRDKNELDLRFIGTTSLRDNDAQGDWTPTLGGAQSFIGIYRSFKPQGDRYKADLWLAISSNQPSLSEALYKKIEDSENMTWEQFFIEDKKQVYQWTALAAKRNRKRLITSCLHLLGIDISKIPKEVDTLSIPTSSYRECLVPTDMIETITNKVVPWNNETLVYYSQTTKTNSADGIIFTQNPFAHISVLTCTDNLDKLGASWKGVNDALNLFPVNTGSMHESTRKPPEDHIKLIKDKTIFWKDHKEEHPSLRTNFHVRDRSFKLQEKKLGYARNQWHEYDLFPLLVHLSNDKIPN